MGAWDTSVLGWASRDREEGGSADAHPQETRAVAICLPGPSTQRHPPVNTLLLPQVGNSGA